MSLRFEQHRALLLTREFMLDMLQSDTRPKTVKEMKERARRCLRHYPFLKEDGEPMFSQDDFKP